MQLPSRLIESAVDQMASLPGIGRRTALRLVLHMLARDEERVRDFAESMVSMRQGVKPCSTCHNPTEDGVCNICANPHRDSATLCVVEDIRDLLALESVGEYRGLYHILGGVISPMDGVGPADLTVESLVARVQSTEVKEVILALPASMEGDTTAFYLAKRVQAHDILLTTIARGVSVGEALQYADEATLSSSLLNRLPYKG
ncbi:MAG TPA: recombination protein RecR [Flavobacteriales bacterium]|nr:recombination protein RecR [Crocinitomicaceae bacterium]HCC63957.1 recombination protein RecR [Flavobacteriales bacterium]|tara:strand:- start:170 stop:775 length:606 start_codon:yes stop_codon:yes gene_type:complete